MKGHPVAVLPRSPDFGQPGIKLMRDVRLSKSVANAVLFFGAGSSAPFGIPTMQQMVDEFEESLRVGRDQRQEELYREIRSFLSVTLARPIDLEAVFTIVDSIINWSPDRMGIAALYHALKSSPEPGKTSLRSLQPPATDIVETAQALEAGFEKFVQNACQIREGTSARIDEVYKTFFDGIGNVIGGYSVQGQTGRVQNFPGPMFTTNYDAVLEHYWLDLVRVSLNTGFSYDNVAGMLISTPDSLRQNDLRLFKLHGSVTWYMDDYGRLTEQRVPPQGMRTVTGRRFTGQVMLYPIEEKDLFVEPYQTMYLMLNRELAAARHWIVVGYSFGDRILRELFIQSSQRGTNLIILHPHATKVAERLHGFRGNKKPINSLFAGDDYPRVIQEVQTQLQRG